MKLGRCDSCGRPWIRLGGVQTDDGVIHELVAAHDCDGVGVVASWYRDEQEPSGWRVRATDLETAGRPLLEEDCVPPMPPLAPVTRTGRMEIDLHLDQPWSVPDALRRLLDLARHLREAHDCDRHGHEEDRAAVAVVQALLQDIERGP